MKKLGRQLVALNLAILLVLCSLGTAGTAAAAETPLTRGLLASKIVEIMEWTYDESMDTGELSDVPAGYEFHDAIYLCVSKSVLSPTAEGSVSPEANMTRAEVAGILCNTGLSYDWASTRPDDVESNTWYYSYVMRALGNDVMSCISENKFAPNQAANLSDVDWEKLAELVGPYDITVDGVTFKSNEDTYAPGYGAWSAPWRYESDSKYLYLHVGYSGAPISAKGDLSIYALDDDITISGEGVAIQVTGSLIMSGSVVVSTTGNTYQRVGVTVRSTTGNAIQANDVSINSGTIYGGTNGVGISAKTVYVLSGDIWGGINYQDWCIFDAGYISVHGKISGTDWTYNTKHTKAVQTEDLLIITPNTYTLTLDGNGGMLDGQTAVEVSEAYVSSGADLQLYKYRFERDGYVQTGYAESANGTAIYGMNTTANISKDAILYATWVAVRAGETVLLSDWRNYDGYEYGTKFTNGQFYLKLSSASTALPTTMISAYDGSTKEVVAWRDTPEYRSYYDEKMVYPAGTTIKPDSTGVRVLYPVINNYGYYCFYHLNGATNANGADLLLETSYWARDVENIWDSTNDCYISFNLPEGKRLAGWATSEGSDTVVYYPGDQLPLSGGEVLHLYAVWKDDTRIQLDPPTDLKWGTSTGYDNDDELYGDYIGTPGCVSWMTTTISQNKYSYIIYRVQENGKDEIPQTTFDVEMSSDSTRVFRCWESFHLSIMDFETGDYYFTVQNVGDGINYTSSEWVKSPIWHYVKPKTELTVQKPICVERDGENGWTWTADSKAEKYHVYLLYSRQADGVYREINQMYRWEAFQSLSSFDWALNYYGSGYYKIKIRALPRNIEETYISEWSELSDPIYYSETLDTVKETIAAVDALTAEQTEAVASLVEDIKKADIQTVVVAMNSDANTLARIEKLEKLAGQAATVSVAAEVTDIDESKVGVIGAGLNAAEGQQIELKIEPVAAEVPVREELYKDTVQFSMDLVDVNTQEVVSQEGQELEVPVKIKLPIPAQINPAFLVVLHHHSDETYDEVWPTITYEEGQWYAGFVITSFSDFTLAEMKAEASDTGVDLTLQLTDTLKSQATSAYCAVYDENNKLLGVATPILVGGKQTVSIACKTPSAARRVKVILLDDKMAPVGAAAQEIEVSQ